MKWKAIAFSFCALWFLASGYASTDERLQAILAAKKRNSPKIEPVESGSFIVQLRPGQDPDAVASAMGITNQGPISGLNDWYHFEAPQGKRDLSSLASFKTVLSKDIRVRTWEVNTIKQGYSRKTFSDPGFSFQWHLKNTGQIGAVAGNDVNISGVWDANIFGDRIGIQIVDDGLDYKHPDFSKKYLSDVSHDYLSGDLDNPNDQDSDPFPPEDSTHGTSCAGVAAASSNRFCGVGAAPSAKVSAVRIVGGAYLNSFEAETYAVRATKKTFISSNSWGAADNGEIYSGVSTLTNEAFRVATKEAYDGLGLVLVWAAGNGRQADDSCSFDGYATSPYTIAVTASNAAGVASLYSEACAGTFVSAPSNDFRDYPSIYTTSVAQQCDDEFGGTSSATPLVAGVIALMLQVNPSLSYRDVKHILALTSDQIDSGDNGWTTNAAGYKHNPLYGFGRVNAGRAVEKARTWVNKPQEKLITRSSTTASGTLSSTPVTRTFVVDDSIDFVEHVLLKVDITHPAPNQLRVVLTSPSGTQSVLAEPHRHDFDVFLTAEGNKEPLNYFLASPPVNVGKVFQGYRFYVPNPACTALDLLQVSEASGVMGDDVVFLFSRRPTCTFDQQRLLLPATPGVLILSGDLDIRRPSEAFTVPNGLTYPVLYGGEFNAAFLLIDSTGVTSSFTAWAQTANDANSNGDLSGGFPLASVRHWGEAAVGTWTVQVTDAVTGFDGTLQGATLEVRGFKASDPPLTGVRQVSGGAAAFPRFLLLLLAGLVLLW